LKTTDFDYHLPESSIAQTPLEPRDSSRLLILHRESGEVEHRIFRDVSLYLQPNDLLILNQTRVIPARIFAHKETGGKVEILLLRRRDTLTWEALVGGKGLRVDKKVLVEVDEKESKAIEGEIVEILDGSERLIRFSEPIERYFSRIGNVPLPPYIHKKLNDPERYQTVYAKEPGSAAAPTAGLHFTPQLLEELKAKGVTVAYVTLHVGLDTFAPVNEDDPEEHKIHTEWCELSHDTADLINHTKQSGGRVVAVGTTSVRTLESAVVRNRKYEIENSNRPLIAAFTGPTSLYILPGYQFKVVDRMITNFHLPKSTLLMLVSAFAGREKILATYDTAIKEGYRFYSFGDAMLIM